MAVRADYLVELMTLRAMFFASCKGSSQGSASDMSASACERSPDCRHVFRRPIGQGAERSRTEPSPPAGPSERQFGRTLRPGAISDDSAGCRQRSLWRRPRPAFCGRVPSAAPGSPISITPAALRTWMSEADLQRFVDGGRKVALPIAVEGSASSKTGSHRGGDRRPESRGD
jgi:hypothetical protein